MLNFGKDIITENIDVNLYINEYMQELKYKDIVVDSLDEALKLAQTYKSLDKYNWFRGQSGIWPLIPSANRVSDEERNEAEVSLLKLDAWASKNDISVNPDYVEAIAQHYHIPTLFIDFTTDPKVAAYFASQKSGHELNEYSCIYCLNTEDFNEQMKFIQKHFDLPSYPRLIDIDIENLWRLEAQKGKFMYQPMINLDWFYSLHRIIFKNNKSNSKLFDMTYIYPSTKSVLEERLDGFFLNERTGKNLEQLYSLIDQLKDSGTEFMVFKAEDEPLFSEIYVREYVNEDILLNYTWNEADEKLWANKKVEKFEDVYTIEKFVFKLESFKNIDKNKEMIYTQLINVLRTRKNIRTKAIRFSIQDGENNDELIKKFENYSNIIWNGMRKLPYDDNEIAEVISKLVLVMNFSRYEYEKTNKSFLRIGINDGCGGFNNAYVNENLLFEAMREDLDQILKEKDKDVRNIILLIKDPKLLYKFDALKNLFVESLIISQVVYGGNDFVIFSPCDLEMLGLP